MGADQELQRVVARRALDHALGERDRLGVPPAALEQERLLGQDQRIAGLVQLGGAGDPAQTLRVLLAEDEDVGPLGVVGRVDGARLGDDGAVVQPARVLVVSARERAVALIEKRLDLNALRPALRAQHSDERDRQRSVLDVSTQRMDRHDPQSRVAHHDDEPQGSCVDSTSQESRSRLAVESMQHTIAHPSARPHASFR
jgi:hypothetical protein